jgi:hypothetical protein
MRHAQMKPHQIAKPADVEARRRGSIFALEIVHRWFCRHRSFSPRPGAITIKISRLVNIRIADFPAPFERSDLP